MPNILDHEALGLTPIMGNRYYYCNDEGERVGIISLQDEGVHIAMYSIRSITKGSGLGTRLVEKIKALAADKGIPVVIDWVTPDAVPYWESMGFEISTEHRVISAKYVP